MEEDFKTKTLTELFLLFRLPTNKRNPQATLNRCERIRQSSCHWLHCTLENVETDLYIDLQQFRNILKELTRLDETDLTIVLHDNNKTDFRQTALSHITGEESFNLLKAHEILQELESMRNEVVELLHEIPDSLSKLELIENLYNPDIIEITDKLWEKMIPTFQNLLPTLLDDPQRVVTCIRIIDREERADLLWNERKKRQEVLFIPPDRPKQWKNKFFDHLKISIQHKLGLNVSQMNKDNFKDYLHNLQTIFVNDLTLAEYLFNSTTNPLFFPPDWEMFHSIFELYHFELALFATQTAADLNEDFQQTVHFILWLRLIQNFYLTNKKNLATIQVDWNKVNLLFPKKLLSKSVKEDLRNFFVQMTIKEFQTFSTNLLETCKMEWNTKGHRPDLLDNYFYGNLSKHLHSGIDALLKEESGKPLLDYMGNKLKEDVLFALANEIIDFMKTFKCSIEDYLLENEKNLDNLNNFLFHLIAIANDCDYNSKEFMTTFAEHIQPYAVLKHLFLELQESFANVRDYCIKMSAYLIVQQFNSIFMNDFMTNSWLRSGNLLASEVEDALNEQGQKHIQHLLPIYHFNLLQQIQHEIGMQMLFRMLIPQHRKLQISNENSRKQLAYRLVCEANEMLNLFSSFIEALQCQETILQESDNEKRRNALKTIIHLASAINITNNEDAICSVVNQIKLRYPDMNSKQVQQILVLRGDLKNAKIKEICERISTSAAGILSLQFTTCFSELDTGGMSGLLHKIYFHQICQ